MALTAAVFGSTGLVGKALIEQLERDTSFAKIYCYSRKPPLYIGKKSAYKPFDTHDFKMKKGVDVVFCALGTTIKKAGSKSAFEEVDLHAVERIAQKAKSAGIPKLAVVSSTGAHTKSRNFYLRTKGKMEEAVANTGIPQILIVRPSLLLGKRDEKRGSEDVARTILKPLAPIMIGPLLKYRPIEAVQVAKVMIFAIKGAPGGTTILENNKLHSLL